MTEVLMSTCEYFDVAYAINPHMLDAEGNPHKIDRRLAMEQWQDLKKTFERLGIKVGLTDAAPGLPDMVFASNHGMPLPPFEQRRFLLGSMATEERSAEVPHFATWYAANGWEVIDAEAEGLVEEGESFEGMGDAAFRPQSAEIWVGNGARTSAKVWERIADRFDLNLRVLNLLDPRFYHLDTCFSILDPDTAVFVPHAFDVKSVALIEEGFERIVSIDLSDATKRFAGNCWCPDGKHVILQEGSQDFEEELEELGFIPVPVNTSEFIKAGGSVYCMKMILHP